MQMNLVKWFGIAGVEGEGGGKVGVKLKGREWSDEVLVIEAISNHHGFYVPH